MASPRSRMGAAIKAWALPAPPGSTGQPEKSESVSTLSTIRGALLGDDAADRALGQRRAPAILDEFAMAGDRPRVPRLVDQRDGRAPQVDEAGEQRQHLREDVVETARNRENLGNLVDSAQRDIRAARQRGHGRDQTVALRASHGFVGSIRPATAPRLARTQEGGVATRATRLLQRAKMRTQFIPVSEFNRKDAFPRPRNVKPMGQTTLRESSGTKLLAGSGFGSIASLCTLNRRSWIGVDATKS